MSSPNFNIDTGVHRAVLDCLVAAEQCVKFQAITKISNTEVTAIANSIKLSGAGWSNGGVYANVHGFISAS